MRSGFGTSAPLQPHPLPPLAADCIGLWRLDEAAAGTNFDDISANNRDLTVAGSPGVAGPIITVPYATVGSRSFNGATQWGVRAHDASEEMKFQDEWTIEAFIRPATVAAGRRTIFSFSEYQAVPTLTGNEQCWFGLSAAGLAVRWENGSGANVDADGGSFPLVANCRYHVAARKMRSRRYPGRYRVDFFVNGRWVTPNLASYDNLSNSTGGTISRMTIGACFRDGASAVAPGSLFNGRIDDVIITPVAKTDYAIREDCMRGFRPWSFQYTSSDTGTLLPQTKPAIACLTRVRLQVAMDVDDLWEHYYCSFGHAPSDSGDASGMNREAGFLFANKFQFLKSISISDDIEAQATTASIVLFQNARMNNVSPFTYHAANAWNPLNTTETSAADNKNAIASLRKVIVEVCPMPAGMTDNEMNQWFERTTTDGPSSTYFPMRTWVPVFEGFVSSAVVQGAEATLACIDNIFPLQIAQIEPSYLPAATSGNTSGGHEYIYGSAGGTAVEDELQRIINDADPARHLVGGPYTSGNSFTTDGSNRVVVLFGGTAVPGGEGRAHAFKVGDRFEIRGTTNFNGVYTVTSIGGWTITSVETPGPLAFENSGQVYSVKGFRGVSPKPPQVWTPTSPAWNVYEWNASISKSVAQELEDVAANIGWLCRYRWDDDLGMFRLKFYNPSTSPDAVTLSPHDILSVDRQSVKSDDVRNIGFAEYGSTVDNIGNKGRFLAAVVRRDSADKHGRRIFRIGLGSKTLITSAAEASDLITQVANDLEEPQAEVELTVPLRLDIETGDTITIPNEDDNTDYLAEPRYFANVGASMAFGCIGVTHDISDGSARTKLKLRGASAQPSRPRKHFDMIDQAGVVSARGTRPPSTPSAPSVDACKLSAGTNLYGLRVYWSHPVNNLNAAWDEMEVHVSTTNGFTPSSVTLKAVTRSTEITFFGLAAVTTYYVKLIARDRMRNASAPSNQTSRATPA